MPFGSGAAPSHEFLGGLGRVSWICGFCDAFRLERWERWWEAGLPDSGAVRTPKREGVWGVDRESCERTLRGGECGSPGWVLVLGL